MESKIKKKLLLINLVILFYAPSTLSLGNITKIQALEGTKTVLSCENPSKGTLKVVSWYRYTTKHNFHPIYGYDNRNVTDPKSWIRDNDIFSDGSVTVSEVGEGRKGYEPAVLVLDPVQSKHAGKFRCQVVYVKFPSVHTIINLTVIVPPEKPSIFDDRGVEIQLDRIGPYPEDSDLSLTCVVAGGNPPPVVQWWHDGVLLNSSNKPSSSPNVKVKQLTIHHLGRVHKGASISCKAYNTDLIPPVTRSVTLDMYLRPTTVSILSDDVPLSAGRRLEMGCEAIGSDPAAKINWWLADEELTDTTQKDLDGGNYSLSTVYFTPQREDDGKMLTCLAKNIHIEGEHIETTMQLNIDYAPKAELYLGSILNPDDIEEGDDVYFECKINAKPSPYKVLWKHNNEVIIHNQREGIITSSSHLALQNIRKDQAGNYSCLASNVEGDGESNSVDLKIMYKPTCQKDNTLSVYGLVRGETAKILCSVDSFPAPKSFRWSFNNSAETRDLQETVPKEQGDHSSSMTFQLNSEMDYGTILCWATNLAGQQLKPCVFHIIGGGKPDPPHNCTLQNQTDKSFDVDCQEGYDGGQRQNYVLEAYNQDTGSLQLNMTSTTSHFVVKGLKPAKQFSIVVYASNTRGRSDAAYLDIFTLNKVEKLADEESSHYDKYVILLVVGMLVTVLIILVSTIVVLKMNQSNHLSNEALQQSPKEKKDFPLNNETESLYGDKNPDVIQFNKGAFHREPGFPESDYQLEGATGTGQLIGDNEWMVPQMVTTTSVQCPAVHSPNTTLGSRMHLLCGNIGELPFDNYKVAQQVDYDTSSWAVSSPSYGTVSLPSNKRPSREVVTVQTPLIFSSQQETRV